MNGELNFGGVFLPPLMAWICLAIVPFLLLRKAMQLAGVYRLVWHRSLFDIALYVLLVGAIDALTAHLF